MGLKLKDILSSAYLKEAKLLTNINFVENVEVSGITIVERPDIANWIKGGELLLTSFYSIDKDIEAQKKLIEDVARNGAAGVIIKVSEFMPILDPLIIETGNQEKIPIIEISKDIKYIEILYPIMAHLFNEQLH